MTKSFLVVYGLNGKDANKTFTVAFDVEYEDYLYSKGKLELILDAIVNEHSIQHEDGSFDTIVFYRSEIAIKSITLI